MEDAMNPEYEFLTNQWKQMIAENKIRTEIKLQSVNTPTLRAKLFDRLGDVMISGGTWLKKSANLQIDDQPMVFSTRN
jgi:hypothetical protein